MRRNCSTKLLSTEDTAWFYVHKMHGCSIWISFKLLSLFYLKLNLILCVMLYEEKVRNKNKICQILKWKKRNYEITIISTLRECILVSFVKYQHLSASIFVIFWQFKLLWKMIVMYPDLNSAFYIITYGWKLFANYILFLFMSVHIYFGLFLTS